MIRFACPGCNATYTVDDSKGGKAGKCPKCAAQFVIPAAEVASAPPPPPPPAPRRAPPPPPPPPPAADAPVEIKPCPKCGARLSVAVADLGSDVECPYCQKVYPAKRADAPEPAAERPSRRRDEPPPAGDRPSRRRPRDDEDDDRPRRRPAAEVEDDAPDDEDDRPRRKRKKRRYAPHRGTTILLLGIFGFLCCGFLAVAALIMGFQDIAKMNSGEMDPDGKTTTVVGMVFGVLGVVVWIGSIIFRVAMMGK